MEGPFAFLNRLPFRTRLSAILIVACLVPLSIASVSQIFVAKDAIHEQAFNQLDSLAAVKKGQVESYFAQIRDQVITFSESRMIVDATQDFRSAFETLESEQAVSPEELQDYRAAIRDYYSNQFGATYAGRNGSSPNVSALLPSEATSIIAQYRYIADNPNPLGSKEELDFAPDGSTYAAAHDRYHPIIRNYLRKFGYYDIFLVDPDSGHIVYSVFKEIDYATSLIDGPYKDTNFARAFREARALPAGDAVALVDFEAYLPSYEAAASFIASPVFENGELQGVLVFQMPVGRINTIMQERTGLGESGETYLIGADLKMRSQSRFIEDDTIIKTTVDTQAARAVASGESGSEIISDYRGVPVLSSYLPLNINGLEWGILAEIDSSEAFGPVNTLMSTAAATVAAGIGLALLLAFMVSRSVMNTLGAEPTRLSEVVNAIANDDLSMEFDDEHEAKGVYADAQEMQRKLKERIELEEGFLLKRKRIMRALDSVDSSVMIADEENVIRWVNESAEAMFTEKEARLRTELPNFRVSELLGSSIDVFHKDPSHQSRMLAALKDTHTSEFEIDGIRMQVNANPIFDRDGTRLGTVVEWQDITVERSIETEVQSVVEAALRGELGARISLEGKDGFIRTLSDRVNALMQVSEEVIQNSVNMFSELSQGNLTKRIEGDYDGMFAKLKNDANATADRLGDVVGGIQQSAAMVRNGAEEIASGNTDLSERTERQAGSLEQTASSMEEMTATVKQSADNAASANTLAEEARHRASEGGSVVDSAVSAMQEIHASSNKIENIIAVIDEIAFQTNLLALNASVEAARAGEQGRGFAVVASEVRNLAGRSATAAREIKELIEDSSKKVEEGSRLVDESGETLRDIVERVTKVSDIISEMAAASNEQSQGIVEVNESVRQMDDMTQQNAALVEEISAASVSMGTQAAELNRLIDFFQTGEEAAFSIDSSVREDTWQDAPKAANTDMTPLASTGTDDDWTEF